MKNIFVALLIFIFVMCFFFIPHGGASQPLKAEFSIIGICQDDSRLRIGIEQSTIPMAQMPLINLNLYEKNLLYEPTHGGGGSNLSNIKVSALAYEVTGYKTIKPWMSFHAGKHQVW